jgi:hypothetical protein
MELSVKIIFRPARKARKRIVAFEPSAHRLAHGYSRTGASCGGLAGQLRRSEIDSRKISGSLRKCPKTPGTCPKTLRTTRMNGRVSLPPVEVPTAKHTPGYFPPSVAFAVVADFRERQIPDTSKDSIDSLVYRCGAWRLNARKDTGLQSLSVVTDFLSKTKISEPGDRSCKGLGQDLP